MSLPSSPPLSPNPSNVEDGSQTPSHQQPSSYPVTRTVAIIKNHALDHRFEIERRIQEATFEIVKERQMEFDTETDPDTLYELFGNDAASFSEGPVWVYVLERRRAVEVWNTLMGDPDPAVARQNTPNSLRALYGISSQQNGLMGSSDSQMAELQIASLFVSSPPFPTSDLPDDQYGSLRSVNSSVLAALQQKTISDEGYAASSVTSPSTVGGTQFSANGKPTFRARPIPATNAAPDIVPRMTRSAALRQGILVEKTRSGPRVTLTKEQLHKTFENVPGHKRTEIIQVASTAPPVVAPRMTRAASLRQGIKPEPVKRRTLSSADAVRATFEGVPGHKRRESIAVSSVQTPTVAPRLNKSAALRAQKEQGPAQSSMFRKATAPKLPGALRNNSLSPAKPITNTAAPLRPTPQPSPAKPPRPPVERSATALGTQALTLQKTNSSSDLDLKPMTNGTREDPVAKARPRPSSAMSNPVIMPRTNKSAALRLAKKEAENQAAAAAAARKNPRAKIPPSSFKSVVV